jgi:type II secretory pathway predicted ATPase ExeA
MPAMALSELRSLISDEFDSKRILTVVLAGDMRLSERLKADELIPLSRRIRCRLTLSPMADDEMMKMLEHALREAGNPKLITSGCLEAIVAHSGGNPATMMLTADELFANAMASEKTQIDEAIFFQAFQIKTPASSSKMPKGQKNR